ncbi:MAG: phage antirepressor KilAC domain-containing protein [Ruminiclostridium sp.]|nr:phage antirepressor KilAC domain-containing protein [Ruminiclostridium sp.]
MENNLQIFENAHFGKIRTLDINGEVWFVGKDICLAFGDENHRRSLGRIDEDDRKTALIPTAGGRQRLIVINESGLYSLLFAMKPQKSHKGVSDEYPLEVKLRIMKLREFKRWVTSEVLPSIRKHGAYVTDELLEEIAANKEAAEKLFRELKEEKAKSRDLEEQLEANEPKCDFYDKVLQAQGLIPMTAISKDYGMSATRMNAMLYAFGVQYKMHCGTWVLYADYQDLGYTQTVTIFPRYDYNNPRLVMYWTHTGREFLYRFLKERGLVPVMERKSHTI